jgi:hypothetical protein
MKRLKKIKAHHIATILFIVLILSFIIGRKIIVKERENIFKEGQISICKVYRVHCDGEVAICDGYYFFYFHGKKYFSYYLIEPHKTNPVGKYYKVFFNAKNPNRSAVDYSKEISTDSVYKYFQHEQNLFEMDSTKVEYRN